MLAPPVEDAAARCPVKRGACFTGVESSYIPLGFTPWKADYLSSLSSPPASEFWNSETRLKAKPTRPPRLRKSNGGQVAGRRKVMHYNKKIFTP